MSAQSGANIAKGVAIGLGVGLVVFVVFLFVGRQFGQSVATMATAAGAILGVMSALILGVASAKSKDE